MNSFEAKIEGSVLYLAVKFSRLSALTARAFKADCDQVWKPGLTSVEADLTAVEFIDSSGVEALLSLYKRQPPGNPNVKLVHVRPPVQAVIELLRLHRVFEIVH